MREPINCVPRAVAMPLFHRKRFWLAEVSGVRTSTLAEIRMQAEIEAIEEALRRHGHNLIRALREAGLSGSAAVRHSMRHSMAPFDAPFDAPCDMPFRSSFRSPFGTG